MMRIRTLTLIAITLLGLAACGKKDGDKADQQVKTPPAEPVAAPPPAPTPPPPPPAPVYSAEAAAALVGQLGDCVIPDNCEAFKTLVGFGPQVAPKLLTALTDPAVSIGAKRMAAQVLGMLKQPEVGVKLIELGSAIDDHMAQSDFFKAAGQSGGQATFDKLIAEFAKAEADLDDDREIPLRAGLRAFPAESVAWAVAELGKKGLKNATGPADLITDNATAADVPAIVVALGKVKDPMARHRLAAKAIEHGDTAHFGVFVAGLQSSDQYDRSDAANFLGRVADKAPEDMKAKLIELLEKAKAGDAGGLTSMGYDESLKKLGK